ncbi:MAG: TonB-dependent receptor [Acidobacteriales bacterium]|nr:TonB-dependent receptor [Terriglobales bacterium]
MMRSIRLACWTFLLLLTTGAFAQSTATADLRGTVRDPNGAVVAGANLTLRDDARNFERTTTTTSEGEYFFALVPPGNYTLTVDASGFGKLTAKDVKLTIGSTAEYNVALKVATATTELTVSATAELIETSKTSVSTTIDQQRIDNLPINQRDYISFAQTQSQVNRDNGRPIGPAPTSGLNIGGQRGRSTLVQVDGADNTDNSVNAARSTVSQEAVQEFQVVTNSYSAEYGRASGGVINVVTNHSSFQADNRFAPVSNPPYTRTQYGLTFGGPIVKDKTFFFASFEQRRRQESGFFTSNVDQGLTGSVTFPVIPGLNPILRTFDGLTPAQVSYINTLLGTGVPAAICGARAYAFFASTASNIALNGLTAQLSPNDGSLCPAISPIAPGAIGPRFILSGAPVPFGTTNSLGQFIAFRPLNSLQTIFPVSEGTTFSSIRLDHRINNAHLLTFRVGFNPNVLTGIQVESQNQALGQNDFSRTGVQRFRDWSALVGLNSTLTPHIVNEANFNYGRRSAAFRSQNNDAVAFNIAGTAFIGRELFSPVKRVESRYQIRDTVSWSVGKHLIKFGGDFNWININADFELNFAGLYNFGGLSATILNAAFAGAPDFTPVQQYGLGFPASFIQGFGNPRSSLDNKPMSLFLQDSWQLRPGLTLNLGVRYDKEFTKQIAPVSFTDPLTGTVLSPSVLRTAQDSLNVQQGFPRDNNNVAPRVALAWDPWNNGKTVVRAAYGLFYDHPLLAVAFNSDIADAAQQQQFITTPGSPASTALLNAVQIFQGTVCVPGAALTPVCAAQPPGTVTPGVAASAEYQFGRQRFNDQTFPGFGPVLPFTLPVAKDFQYAYANQGSFSIEHQLSNDLSVSVGYLFVGARHLPRPIDINAPQNNLTIDNFRRFSGGVNPANSTQAVAFSVPLASNATYTVLIPGMVAIRNSTGLAFVAPAIANFFRPSGPNYFLAAALSGGAVSKAVLDSVLGLTLRTPGPLSPFGSVNSQSSTGTSDYNALNVDLKKRFSKNFSFLASYTWSHSIDDSSDLQTLLLPQDNYNVRAERADSLFDQRQRFVFSGVVTSPAAWDKGSGVSKFFSNFTFAPILEISSGRPFNILTNIDTNNDQSSQTDRPNVGAGGVLVRPPDFDATCSCFPAGNLGRNRGINPMFWSLDMRIMRSIKLGERFRFDLIAEGFNLANHVNIASSSPFFQDVNAFNERSGNRYRSRPTAAFDPRQFQFGLKLTF